MLFESYETTYDAYVHIFFAEHYASHWFDHWNYKWYTGFTVTSYPPLIHQTIALFSKLVGFKLAFIITALASIMIFIRGVFYFSSLWVSERAAAYASCAAGLCSSYVEAIHIFGQLPSITGIAILLNILPFIYWWVRKKKSKHVILALLLLSIVTCTHHVTTIFGMVFFIFPIIGLALLDDTYERDNAYTIVGFLLSLKQKFFSLIGFGVATLCITILSILPYWAWSRADPISQIPIPHGSRDSFIEVTSSGLIFFLIPWGMMLLFLPFLFKQIFKKRVIILGLSLTLAFILGTGGTTPIPRMLLGETAFNILTLDRFTYWATILALPFWGQYIHQLIEGDFKKYLSELLSPSGYKILLSLLAVVTVGSTIFIMNIGFFRPFQPKKIDVQPIVNFLSRDDHDKWRYMTLGFGDQVAWLAANTDALSIDGNYHSARRLPEMTTRVVERLENAKYQGLKGLGALNQFLTIPEKYNLKYIFCNDKFYEPILYFSGWNKIRRLENDVDVWEKPDILALPDLLPRKNIPSYQQLMWSTIPIGMVAVLFFFLIFFRLRGESFKEQTVISNANSNTHWKWHSLWAILVLFLFLASFLHAYITNRTHQSPDNIIDAYYHALDFKYFDEIYTFYDPISRPDKAQIFLDISLEDGIANSFGKLNSIQKTITLKQDTLALAVVDAEWVTALSSQTITTVHKLIKRDNRWYLKAPEHEIKIPPQQIVTNPTVNYEKLGRREAMASGTDHKDILDRPDIGFDNIHLIQNEGQYFVIGEIMNTDIVPAYITISGCLTDEKKAPIICYNARDKVIQRLAPKERSPFMIEFDEISRQHLITQLGKDIDYDINPFDSLPSVIHANIQIKALVNTDSPYVNYGIKNLEQEQGAIYGELYNFGHEGVNIPRVLAGFYTKDNKLMWVENIYLEKEVRPLRSKQFVLNTHQHLSSKIMYSLTPDDIKINGFNIDQNRFASERRHHKLSDGFSIDFKANGYIIE